MSWVAGMTGYNPVSDDIETLYFALGPGLALSDSAYIPSGLIQWQSFSQKIDTSATGGVELAADAGQLEILNVRPNYQSAGPWDYLVYWSWKMASLYWVTNLFATKTLVSQSVLQEPVSDLTAATLTFPLRDPRYDLNAPLQSLKYGGTNVGGQGVDGESDLTGVLIPVLYGVVSNIPGVKVNNQKLIWQIADHAASILCCRDGAVSLTADTVRSSLASLQANVPPSGCFDLYAGSEGTFVRLGSTPVFTLTFDASEGASEALRTHAQVWQRMRVERCGTASGSINGISVTATDILTPHEVGFWWNSDITRLDAINTVLTSLSGYEVLDFEGEWNIGKLELPSGAPVINLFQMTDQSALKVNDRPIETLVMARPNYAPDGIPPYRVNVQWGYNYTVMAASDFAGGAPERLKTKFSIDWRVETNTNTAIWDPVAMVGPWPEAPELTVSTGYQPGADGLTCPHAVAESAFLGNLYEGLRGQYQLSYTPNPTDQIMIGQVVSLTYPQMGLGAGALFNVLQAGFAVDTTGQAAIALVIGFQA